MPPGVSFALCPDDNKLHIISSCRDLDFTFAFEEGFLVLGLSLVAILSCGATLCRSVLGRFLAPDGSGSEKQHKIAREDIRSFNALYIFERAVWLISLSLSIARLAVIPSPAVRSVLEHWPHRLVVTSRVTVVCALLIFLPTAYLLHRFNRRPRTRLQLSCLCLLVGQVFSSRTMHRASLQPLLRTDMFLQLAFIASVSVLLAFEVLIPLTQMPQGQTKTNVEKHVGIFGRATLFWLFPLLWQGRHASLKLEDLWPVAPEMSARPASEALQVQLDRLKSANWKRSFRGARLLLALFRAFPFLFLAPIVPRLLQLMCTLMQPLIISALISAISPSMQDANSTQAELDPFRAWSLVAVVPIVYLGMPLFQSICSYHLSMLDVTFRSAVISCVFRRMISKENELDGPRKAAQDQDAQSRNHTSEEAGSDTASNALETSNPATADPTVLMSVDVEHIASSMTFYSMYELLSIGPCAVIGIWMLFSRVGVAAFAAVGTLVLFVGMGSTLSGRVGARQAAWLQATNSRVLFTSSLVANLRTIFASSYQPYFLDYSQRLRKTEMNSVQRYQTTLAIVAAPFGAALMASIVVLLAVTRALEAESQSKLTPAVIFSSISILNILNLPLQILSSLLSSFLGALASFDRLELYLLRKPVQSRCEDAVEVVLEDHTQAILAEVLRKLRTAEEQQTSEVLHLIGPGATGKTTLIKRLLRSIGENSDLSVAYGPQTVALFEERSILDNITLFQTPEAKLSSGYGVEKDDEKTQQSESKPLQHQVAAVSKVLRFCGLDRDLMALESGVSTLVRDLSGGQRQRIALARALYSKAPIIVLDNPLSALDAITKDMIEGHLYGYGTFDDKEILHGRVILWASQERSTWDVPSSTLLSSREASGFRLAKAAEDGNAHPRDVEAVVSSTDAVEHKADTGLVIDTSKALLEHALTASCETKEAAIEEHPSHLGLAPFRFYFKNSPSSWIITAVIFLLVVVGASNGVQYAVQAWAHYASRRTGEALPNPASWLTLLSVLAVLVPLALILMCMAFSVKAVPQTGFQIHEQAIASLLATSPYNALLPACLKARFSQDIYIVDAAFADQIVNAALSAAFFTAAALTMIVAVPWMALSIPLFAAELWIVKHLYLRSSRQVRGMELESKSNLFAVFSQVSTCLPSLRSLRLLEACKEHCDTVLDNAQRPFYTREAMLRLLRVVFALVAGLVTSVLALLAVALSRRVNPALLGVALVNVSSLSWYLNATLQGVAQIETDAVAVDRIRQIVSLPPEEEVTHATGSAQDLVWRSPGSLAPPFILDCVNLSMRYSPGSPNIIKDICVKIRQGARVGICGRSGSGKSSFLAALLRGVTDSLLEGSLSLQGASRESVGLHRWRKRFSYVTQEPLIWETSLRELLFVRTGATSHTEERRAWKALDAVGLGDLVRSSPHGLDVKVMPPGSTEAAGCLALSTSQSHLVAFARTLVEVDRPLLLLDELSSNLDEAAEKRCLDVILRGDLLQERTILAVSHRISFIASFDHILLFDDGQIVEAGSPAELLASNTIFKRLWELQGCQSVCSTRKDEGWFPGRVEPL